MLQSCVINHKQLDEMKRLSIFEERGYNDKWPMGIFIAALNHKFNSRFMAFQY